MMIYSFLIVNMITIDFLEINLGQFQPRPFPFEMDNRVFNRVFKLSLK